MKNSFQNFFDALLNKPTDNLWIGFFRYCIVGGIAFVVDFGLYLLLTWIGVHYLIAGLIAFAISFAVNFLLSHYFVFNTNASSQKATAEIAKVLAIALIGLLLTEILLWVFHLLNLSHWLSKALACAIVLVWNYLGRKFLVYQHARIPFLSIAKVSAKLLLCVLICIAVGTGLLCAVYTIPADAIGENMAKSAITIHAEGLYPILDQQTTSQLDNWTDSLMLLTAGYRHSGSVLTEAMLINRMESVDSASPLSSLVDYVNHSAPMEVSSYARYWHGYLVALKPMLVFFDYSQIRTINKVVQGILMVVFAALLIEKKLYLYLIPSFFLFGFQGLRTTALSMQFSNVFYIYLLGIIFLLAFYERWKGKTSLLLFFTILGAATAYVDLLTYPLVTFGIPVTLLLVLENQSSFLKQIRSVVCSGISWLIGFAGMWLGKGAIGTLITGQNIFADIFSAVGTRTAGNPANMAITIQSTIKRNISAFAQSDFTLYLFIFCVLLFGLILLHSFKVKQFKHFLNIPAFALVCAAPMCWYIVLKQHSYIHGFFTNKECLIILFAGMTLLVKMYLDIPKNQAEIIK